jgi:endonuclease-3
MPVDARVSRVARRLGFGREQKDFARTARSVREALVRELPQDLDMYRRAFVYLNHHGAATCTATDPHCDICPLLHDCQHGQQKQRAVRRSTTRDV